MAGARPMLVGAGRIGGVAGAGTVLGLENYPDAAGRLRDVLYPPRYDQYPDDPRNAGWRMGDAAATDTGGGDAPYYDPGTGMQIGGGPIPEAKVPGPSRADAYRMGGLAAMDQYNKAPADAWQREDIRGAEADVSPDPYMNPFAASPQQTKVMEKHAGPVDALLVPQSPLDVAMYAMGPAGKLAGVPGKIGALAAGLYGSGIDEAQAGAIGKMGKVLAGKPGGPWEGGIRAYHSSPHDFDKFDWSKLRTGEGANTYGAGFYAAENPAVSGQGGQYWNQFLSRSKNPELEAAQVLRNNNFDRATAIDEVKGLVRHYDDKHSRDMLKLLESGAPLGPRTYEVNINARPELLLDWDKPMTQQDPAIRALAARVGMDPRDYDVAKGAALYRKAGDYFGAKQAGSDFDKAASEGMRDYGIPGIRYLDQGSRQKAEDIRHAMETLDLEKRIRPHAENIHSAWQDQLMALKADPQTYNYVVTDPSKLDILAKYGVVGTAGGGLGAIAASDQYDKR